MWCFGLDLDFILGDVGLGLLVGLVCMGIGGGGVWVSFFLGTEVAACFGGKEMGIGVLLQDKHNFSTWCIISGEEERE